MKITIENLTKKFGDFTAVNNFNATIESGELIALLGPSGCGKSTMLNMLSGILPVTEGKIYFDNDDVTDIGAEKRGVGLVFQNYALYPHMTVLENIAFPLEIKKVKKAEREAKAIEMAKLVHVDMLLNRKPKELSGGQQQRVAIARALVNEPDVLLLDEPLSALDAKLRKEMQQELKRIQQEVGITFIFVTHDQEEALTMSDKIVVLKDGVIEQIGTPTEIYNEPKNKYVAKFIGDSNIVDGIMKKDYLVNFDKEDFKCVDYDFKPNEPVDVIIRPEDIEIKKKNMGKMNGQVISVLFKGVHYEVIVETKRGAAKTIKLHVFDDKDVVNSEANENMHATDFIMDIEDVEALNDSELIQRANAQAWNPDTNEDILISTVESEIKEEAGSYPVTFKTDAGTSITINVSVVVPRVNKDKEDNIGIQAFDVYKSVDEIKESMAISYDLQTWADAYAWYLDTDEKVEIDDVRFNFDPNEITAGDYDVTFVTEGRTYKIHTTSVQKEGSVVSIDFEPDAIHVMEKSIG